MRFVYFFLTSLVTIALIVILDTRLVLPAPLGKLLSPQHGIWQNAEPIDEDFNEELSFPELTGTTEVYFDERLVPHVFAENENDAYFVQGFLHAKFRLWQMELQTHVAAGRLSELVGDEINGRDVLNLVDRYFRRLGLGYAAEKALKEVEKDEETKGQLNAYTAGVNAYISRLKESALPLEYKMLGYKPEPWTNLKTCLFLKYMSYDLAGGEDDFESTNAKSVFSLQDFEKIFPVIQDSLDPIIPKGTVFPTPSVVPHVPVTADSLYFGKKDTISINQPKPDLENGSNNWAVNGTKTVSGAPILCNDPHLSLKLPSVWFEMQIHTPAFNAYGVSFPGAPYIVIGFNDNIAFGETNAGRDVRDYYEIQFKDESRNEYLFNGEWKKTEFRYERIKVKGKPDFVDTVAYTVFGPVMYDRSYTGGRTSSGKSYAVKWRAHDAGNELKVFNGLDRAKNYNDFYDAIKHMQTPGQNFVFASKTGDIAIWAQGRFPAKWRRQGDFIMPGTDSSYLWQADIPQEENPHDINPERGFVSSANQLPADTSYQYYLGGSFPVYRGLIINRYLTRMNSITPQDMMTMQNDNYNVFAEMARPVLLKNVDESSLNNSERKYWDIMKAWNLRDDINETGATIFAVAWDSLEVAVWGDEFARAGVKLTWPDESTLVEALLKDTSFKFVDDVRTEARETLPEIATAAFKKAAEQLRVIEEDDRLPWVKFKDTRVNHLLNIPAFSRLHLPIGGGSHVINATKPDHGPSWRMVVQLTQKTEAYGVYPGGQSGNPGSCYYDSFIDKWAEGKYYKLWVMQSEETADNRVKWKMTFTKD